MITHLFHRWERRLHAVTRDRLVRPFEWGLEWLPEAAHRGNGSPAEIIEAYAESAVAASDSFYAVTPAPHYDLDAQHSLTFESAATTPHPVNNLVHARYFPALARDRRRAVLVLPHWNADETGYVALCQILARFGVSTLRLTLPYHERRMPPELRRADYIVSANIARTLIVNRQAVVDARRAIWWLANRGYEAIGILGTSLGSCLSMLTACHEPLVRAAALNHVSPLFADVVWEGLSTMHVRSGLEGHIGLPSLRRLWMPISPAPFVERMRDKRTLLVYARYDLTFPLHLSRELVREFRARAIPHQVVALPCGHYSTGMTPFKYLDGYVLTRFLLKAL